MEFTRYVCCKSIISYFYLQHNHIITLAQQQYKLDALIYPMQVLRGLGLSKIEPFLPTNMNHNEDNQIVDNSLQIRYWL